ncbi:MAG TPA: WYL domain-containing protein [Clostridia bacterium]|nr:WYL domain-containing protein [Clostridia bacterium]
MDRIKLLIDRLAEKDNCITKAELCAGLDISHITLRRYLDFLKAWGYRFDCSGETVRVIENGRFAVDTVFSKGSYISFKVLMYIYNNNPCSRENIRRYFCKTCKLEGELEGKMTLRNLDIHINRLTELGYIEKYWKGKELCYRTTESVIAADSLSFDKLLGLFNYLNIYGGALPFQEKVGDILDKLESALINYIRRSREAFEDVKLAYEIFPDCIKPRTDLETDLFAKELENHCSRSIMLRLVMDSGSALKVYPFSVVYNFHSGYWYLVCRTVTNGDGYQLIRLDNILSAKPAGENCGMTMEELEAERQRARLEVEESFAISVEEPLQLQVFFKDNEEINEEVMERMEKCNGIFRKLEGFGYCYQGEIHGTMDFLAWLRRLGSCAVIIEPEDLRALHIASARRALDTYQVE